MVRLCSKLEGVALIAGSFYWMCIQPYNHNIMQLQQFDSIEEICHETFCQALVNLYLNDILDPQYTHKCLCCAHIQTFGEFIKKYDNYDEIILKRNNVSNLREKSLYVAFAQKYVDEYLLYFNSQDVPIFEHLQNYMLARLVDFIKTDFNDKYASYEVTSDDITMLVTTFYKLANLHTKCKFLQLWPGAINVVY